MKFSQIHIRSQIHKGERMLYTPVLSLFSATVVSKLCIPDDDHQNYREIVPILDNLVNKNSSTCEENST